MSAWWTYSLSDFLMFSARTYFRQFELMNRELWPLQLLALGAGAVLVGAMRQQHGAGRRIAFVLLALAWMWVGWAYHIERYAQISTGARYFAAAFWVQAGLLAWITAKARAAPPSAGMAGKAALLIVGLALAIYPLLAPLNGRGWWQAEVFALAPDPTVAATFGALLFWRGPWLLWVIPILWSAASGATLMELRAPQAWLLPLVGCLALLLARSNPSLRR